MKYHFVHIPKTAGSGIYKLVEENPDCNIKYENHFTTANELVRIFAFVRNPYERAVSMYFYLIHEDRLSVPLDAAYRHILLRYASFKEFVLNMEKDGLLDVIVHLKPMWLWVTNENGAIVPKIFKIEETDKIDAFLVENGLTGGADSPKLNVSEHNFYETYLDGDIIAEINKLYAKDFELFNYEML
jgi:hypothetical protein